MKKLLITSAVLLSVTGIGSYGLTHNSAQSEDNTPQRVDQLEGQVENHEARITNTEADVTDLQESTGTPPSSQRTEVPQSTPQSESPQPPTQPEAAPVTVVAYEIQPIPGTENENCKYTYSDGTSKVFLWRTVEYNQIRVIHTSGTCDSRVIGMVKT